MTLWDLPTGATLATLPVPGNVHRGLFDASGAVLTELPALLRWPVTEAADGTATIGPPQILHPRGTQDGFAITPDGRTIAAAMYDEAGSSSTPRIPSAACWLRRTATCATSPSAPTAAGSSPARTTPPTG